jgi:hypothetical protein
MSSTGANLRFAMRLTAFLRLLLRDSPRVAAILSHGVKGTNPFLYASYYLRTSLAVTRLGYRRLLLCLKQSPN